MKKERLLTAKVARVGVVASIYAVLTITLGFISYGPIQFRVAEAMTLLPLLGKEYILALTLGTLIANILGPYGTVDLVFGTIATFISVSLVYLTGKYLAKYTYHVIVASIWPTIINAVVIGGMLDVFFNIPFVVGSRQVGIGQFVVVTLIGVPLFIKLESKYSNLLRGI